MVRALPQTEHQRADGMDLREMPNAFWRGRFKKHSCCRYEICKFVRPERKNFHRFLREVNMSLAELGRGGDAPLRTTSQRRRTHRDCAAGRRSPCRRASQPGSRRNSFRCRKPCLICDGRFELPPGAHRRSNSSHYRRRGGYCRDVPLFRRASSLARLRHEPGRPVLQRSGRDGLLQVSGSCAPHRRRAKTGQGSARLRAG